jgi:hypothetical protein
MSTFIIQLLQKIADFLKVVEQSMNLGGGTFGGGAGKLSDIMGMVQIEKVIPATVFQLVVGIYMIEIVLILAYFQNGIRYGFDKTTRNVLIGKTMIRAVIIYTVVLVVALIISSTFMKSSMFGTAIGSDTFG